MKAIAVMMYFTLISTNIHADKKWIPIEPIPSSEKTKPDSNASKLPSHNNLMQNVKIIQQLLDKSRGASVPQSTKNWYSLDKSDDE
ncbi:hypothetical protein [Sulfuricurvum sp.]|uniref:hypothetical protein n=1 Tax=Sulfuricurvum sp. TaxID=2025608 RepID=UPI003C5B5EC0